MSKTTVESTQSQQNLNTKVNLIKVSKVKVLCSKKIPVSVLLLYMIFD